MDYEGRSTSRMAFHYDYKHQSRSRCTVTLLLWVLHLLDLSSSNGRRNRTSHNHNFLRNFHGCSRRCQLLLSAGRDTNWYRHESLSPTNQDRREHADMTYASTSDRFYGLCWGECNLNTSKANHRISRTFEQFCSMLIWECHYAFEGPSFCNVQDCSMYNSSCIQFPSF